VRMLARRRSWVLTLGAVGAVALGCSRGGETKHTADTSAASGARPMLMLMNAASVTQPIRAVLDSFSTKTGVGFDQQPGASLELARLITDLQRHPDVVLLADPDVFPKVLMPQFVQWYAVMARNRIVLAYTERSRGAAEISTDNWRTIVTRPGVEVGRADPNTDPSGYRTLLTMQLAERLYHEPGLYKKLLAAAPPKNVRPREAEQVALLQTHELDYIWTYQNLAENDKLRYVKLPDEIDLGNPADSATYGEVTTRVLGRNPGDSLVMRGAPILFAVTIPKDAPHPDLAQKFLAYLFSEDGRRIMRARHFDALDKPIVFGQGAPAAVASVDSAAGRVRPDP
jgi:molybdate/tungstate transport system substrate-binding protein